MQLFYLLTYYNYRMYGIIINNKHILGYVECNELRIITIPFVLSCFYLLLNYISNVTLY